MGTTIEAVACVSGGGRHPLARGARKLTDAAARGCLARCGRTASDLDLLVNAGIYHDRNLGEPALAALIQEDVGANPGHPPIGGHGTFSFDLYNAACGVLTGAFVADGFLRSRAISLAMVVAGEADPAPRETRGFAFPAAGAALALAWRDDRPGFTDFRFETFPAFADLFRSEVAWEARAAHHGRTGRNVLTVDIAGAYRDRALDCAEEATKAFLDQTGVVPDDVGLFVATGSVPDFGDDLAIRLGVDPSRVAAPQPPLAAAHTVAPIAALDAATSDGRFFLSPLTLFVSAGAGITVANALYAG